MWVFNGLMLVYLPLGQSLTLGLHLQSYDLWFNNKWWSWFVYATHTLWSKQWKFIIFLSFGD